MKLIAILRGINVGGRRKILMADLRNLFNKLGFSNVSTYIQSGNIIFHSNDNNNITLIENLIEKAISEKYDFDVSVIIVPAETINKAINVNPYLKNSEIEIDRLNLTFLKKIPIAENVKRINDHNIEPDSFIVFENLIFGYCNGRHSESKLTNRFIESNLGVSATTRNWRTVLKLSELIK